MENVNNALEKSRSSEETFNFPQYEEVKEVRLSDEHILSICGGGNQSTKEKGVFDLYLNGKKCTEIYAPKGIESIRNISIIGDSIYLKNGNYCSKITNGEITELKDVTNVYKFDGEAVLVKRNQETKTSHIILGEKDLGEYSLIEDIYGNSEGINDLNFNIDFSNNSKEFGFVGKRPDNKREFVGKDSKSEAFDEITVSTNGNYPTIIGKNYTRIPLTGLNRYRESL